jgi:hypothetical protein
MAGGGDVNALPERDVNQWRSLSATIQLACAEGTRTAESAAPTAYQERGWRSNAKNAIDGAP